MSLKSNPERFVVEHDPRSNDAASLWVCIDKKYVPGVGPYRQIEGGAQGAALNVATVWELQKPGSYSEQRLPIPVLTGAMSRVLLKQGVQLALHNHCAAYANGPAIARTIFAKQESVFYKAQQIKPDLQESQFAAIAAAVERIEGANLIAGDTDSDKRLNAIPVGESNLIDQRLTHVDTPIQTGDLVVLHGKNVAWDGHAATAAGELAYARSFDDMEEITSKVSTFMPINNSGDDVLNVSAVWLSATEHFLRVPNGVDELTIRHLAA